MRFSQSPQSKNLLLLGILVAFCCYTALASFVALTAVNGQPSTIALTKAQYAGFVAVAACSLSYSTARPFFKRVLGVTLLLSLFHLINLLPGSFNVGLGFGDLQVGVEPFSLLLLVGYYFLNRTSANTFIRKYLLPAPTPQKSAHLRREAIDQFKQTFARKTDESLRQIVHERKLVTDAVTAAHELLQERKTAIIPASK